MWPKSIKLPIGDGFTLRVEQFENQPTLAHAYIIAPSSNQNCFERTIGIYQISNGEHLMAVIAKFLEKRKALNHVENV